MVHGTNGMYRSHPKTTDGTCWRIPAATFANRYVKKKNGVRNASQANAAFHGRDRKSSITGTRVFSSFARSFSPLSFAHIHERIRKGGSMGLNERRKVKELQEVTLPGRVKDIEEICGKPIP